MGLARVAAHRVDHGNAAAHLRHDIPHDLLRFAGHDQQHLGVVAARDHVIHGNGVDEYDHQRKQDGFKALIHDTGEGDHHKIAGQHQLAHGNVRQLEPQQTADDIGASGGGTSEEHDAQPHAHDHAAENHGKHFIAGKKHLRVFFAQIIEHVDEHRKQRGAHHGFGDKAEAERLPRHDKKRYVDQKHQHTDRQYRQQIVDQNGKSGDAAGHELHGPDEANHRNRVHQRAKRTQKHVQRDIDRLAVELFFFFRRSVLQFFLHVHIPRLFLRLRRTARRYGRSVW